MNRDDIIRIAREAGWSGIYSKPLMSIAMQEDDFLRFAALVAAEKDKEIERLREALRDISISQNFMYQEARAKQALGENQNIWRMCGVNTDDVIKMAEEAGIVMSLTDERVTLNKLNRFLELHLKALRNEGYRQCAEGQRTTQYCGLLDAAVKAERETVATWMHFNDYVSGHGDCIEDLLEELEAQVRESERLKCAEVSESYEPRCDTCPSGVSNAIRARGET